MRLLVSLESQMHLKWENVAEVRQAMSRGLLEESCDLTSLLVIMVPVWVVMRHRGSCCWWWWDNIWRWWCGYRWWQGAARWRWWCHGRSSRWWDWHRQTLHFVYSSLFESVLLLEELQFFKTAKYTGHLLRKTHCCFAAVISDLSSSRSRFNLALLFWNHVITWNINCTKCCYKVPLLFVS